MINKKVEIRRRVCELRDQSLSDEQVVSALRTESPYRPRRLWRELRGLTQANLAELYQEKTNKSVDIRTISHWENFPQSDRPLTVEILANLQDLLEAPSLMALVDERDLEELPDAVLKVIRGEVVASPRAKSFDSTHSASAGQGGFSHLAGLIAARSENHIQVTALNEPNHLMDELYDQIVSVARLHLHINSLELFEQTNNLREEVYTYLQTEKAHKQKTELLLFASILSCLLSDTCSSCGAFHEAQTIANAALSYADAAGHKGLQFWIQARLLATVSKHQGDFHRALSYASKAEKLAENPLQQCQVFNAMAGFCAKTNRMEQSRYALEKAMRARDLWHGTDFLSDEIGGMFAYPIEKELQIQSSNYIIMQDYSDAERMASRSIELYESNPVEERAFGNESLARINLATARMMSDNDFHGAAEALEPVFELPGSKRQSWFVKPLLNLRGQVAQTKKRSGVENDLIERIGVFSSSTAENHAQDLLSKAN